MLVVNTKEIFLLNLHQNRVHFPAERNALFLTTNMAAVTSLANQQYKLATKGAFAYPPFWNKNGWYGMHSQHSVHFAPGSRMDGMAFCPFRNRNAE